MQEIEICVDKRIELIGILLRLSNYKNSYPNLVLNIKNYPYLDDVYLHFSPHKNHRAVTLLNEILIKGNSFAFDVPALLFLNLDGDYNFVGQDKEPFTDRLNKSKLVLEFLKEAKNFVNDTNFEEFYNSHVNVYEEEIQSFKNSVDISNILPFLKKLKIDISGKRFVVILSLLFTKGGYGLNLNDTIFCVTPKVCDKEQNAINAYGRKTPLESSFILHEFCHSFINPLTDKYFSKITFYPLNESNLKVANKVGYGQTVTIINEHVIRAIQICYMNEFNADLSRLNYINELHGFSKDILFSIAKSIEESISNKKSFEENYLNIVSCSDEKNK